MPLGSRTAPEELTRVPNTWVKEVERLSAQTTRYWPEDGENATEGAVWLPEAGPLIGESRAVSGPMMGSRTAGYAAAPTTVAGTRITISRPSQRAGTAVRSPPLPIQVAWP